MLIYHNVFTCIHMYSSFFRTWVCLWLLLAEPGAAAPIASTDRGGACEQVSVRPCRVARKQPTERVGSNMKGTKSTPLLLTMPSLALLPLPLPLLLLLLLLLWSTIFGGQCGTRAIWALLLVSALREVATEWLALLPSATDGGEKDDEDEDGNDEDDDDSTAGGSWRT